MSPIRTHYDNLKVARDAPDFVIRAAYKSLSQRYHPDKNPGDERAAKVMRIINASYEALSDPSRRRAHDAWIAKEEAKHRSTDPQSAVAPAPSATDRQSQESHRARPAPSTHRPSPASGQSDSNARPQPSQPGRRKKLSISDILVGGLVVACGWVVLFAFDSARDGRSVKQPGLGLMSEVPQPRSRAPATPTRYQPAAATAAAPAPAPAAPARYQPPANAPNGQPWPSGAAYVPGYPVDARGGLSELTVDNSRNTSRVFVKLYALDRPAPSAVRQFFIPAHASFTASSLSPGKYDVRYQDLESGGLSRSETFHLEEIPTAYGSQYTTMEITLYKVADGNFQTYPLDESDF